MLPFYVRVQRRLLAGLEAAFVARVHLADVLHFMSALMRVQSALLRAGKITEIAMFLDILLAGFFRDAISDPRCFAAILDENFLLNQPLGILVRD